MYHMYSVLAMQSRTPSTHLSITGHTTRLENITAASMLPSKQDIEELQRNLTVLVGRILTEYIPALSFLSSVVPAHIKHKFTNEMARKSTVSLIDVLMKNEANGRTCSKSWRPYTLTWERITHTKSVCYQVVTN